MSVTIRAARIDDAEAIRSVAEATWHATYGAIYSEDYISNFISNAYAIERLQTQITSVQQDGFSVFDVAEMDKQVVGFVMMRRNTDGSPAVWRFYVLPGHQRQGIGAALLTRLETHLRAYHETRYALGVHKDNEIGKAFYLKHGFVHVAEKDFEDEWWMEKML